VCAVHVTRADRTVAVLFRCGARPPIRSSLLQSFPAVDDGSVIPSLPARRLVLETFVADDSETSHLPRTIRKLTSNPAIDAGFEPIER
jgi:hypothetical protein